MASDGHTYERRAIEAHMLDSHDSPKTGNTLPNGNLYPNNEKRAEIKEWLNGNKGVHLKEQLNEHMNAVTWAASPEEVTEQLRELASFTSRNGYIIPRLQLIRLRGCLEGDHDVWTTEVELALTIVQDQCRHLALELKQRMRTAEMAAERANMVATSMGEASSKIRAELKDAEMHFIAARNQLSDSQKELNSMIKVEGIYKAESAKAEYGMNGCSQADFEPPSKKKKPTKRKRPIKKGKGKAEPDNKKTKLCVKSLLAEALMWNGVDDCRERVLLEVASENQCNDLLGKCLFWGFKDDEQLDSEALDTQFNQLLSDHKSAPLLFYIGECYRKGINLPKDLVRAAEWHSKAASQGLGVAQNILGLCYQHGDGVTKDLSIAVGWYAKAAAKGLAAAQTNLGFCYQNGHGVDVDIAEGVKYYTMAAARGYPLAQTYLGICHQNGVGVEKDLVLAAQLFTSAANHGLAVAQHCLAYCYQNAFGVRHDYHTATLLYSKAAKQGCTSSQKMLDEGMTKHDPKQPAFVTNYMSEMAEVGA